MGAMTMRLGNSRRPTVMGEHRSGWFIGYVSSLRCLLFGLSFNMRPRRVVDNLRHKDLLSVHADNPPGRSERRARVPRRRGPEELSWGRAGARALQVGPESARG